MGAELQIAEKQFFETLLDYEQWANEQWLNTLSKFQNRDRAELVLKHIAGCYSGWITLVDDWVDKPDAEIDLPKDMEELLRRWRLVLRSRGLDEQIEFTGGKGAKRTIRVRELLHHVLNHGTYHRGHLRGLAEGEGMTDFPETDSISYFVRLRKN